MIASLHIENIAIIESLDLELADNFIVMTGETGAGKSILIDSIDMLLGERTSKDLVRSEADKAFVSGVFYNVPPEVSEKLVELGIEPEPDGSLIIQRELSADGRSQCKLNGRHVTVSGLKEVGRLLVNIHGQHDNQVLLNPNTHLTYLDLYSQTESSLSVYKNIYDKVKQTEKRIKELTIDEQEKQRRMEMLEFQIKELENAALQEGEEEELASRRNMLANAEKIIENSSAAHAVLYEGEPNIIDMLGESISFVNAIEKYSPEFERVVTQLENAKYELLDAAETLKGYIENLDFNINSLNETEKRLDLIYRLKKKYGNTISEMLEYLDKAKEEYESIEYSEAEKEKLEIKLKEMKKELNDAAENLSTIRKENAVKLENAIMEQLQYLDMQKVIFKVFIKTNTDSSGEISFTPDGLDNVEFLISTNPGEELKPLAKISSGGELSRIMLSIKSILAKNEPIGTLIFDEIDSGVSGKAAQKIGYKLKELARGKQILCITHLAQIAALADTHLKISKYSEGNKTFTTVENLDRDGRILELSRIIGGEIITETTKNTARELLG